jgi:glucose-1-phosphate thymidylyltransferase
VYLNRGQLFVKVLGDETKWLDAGTPQSLLAATQFVASIEQRTGKKIACLEEIAFRSGFIDGSRLMELAQSMRNDYGEYIRGLVSDGAE